MTRMEFVREVLREDVLPLPRPRVTDVGIFRDSLRRRELFRGRRTE